MMSIPVQCTYEIHENPPAAAAQCGINGLSKNMGTVSDVLAEDMSMLCVDSPLHRQEDVKPEEKVATLLTLDSSPGRDDHLGRDRTRVGVGKHSFFTMACYVAFIFLLFFIMDPHGMAILPGLQQHTHNINQPHYNTVDTRVSNSPGLRVLNKFCVEGKSR